MYKPLLLFLIIIFCKVKNFAQEAFHAMPFATPIYQNMQLGEIKPKGWLLDQLQIMANNSTGHLDEYYTKIKNDNGWLGGNGDGWEETPYWLDGLVPLAFLCNDKKLQQKALRYINWTLDHQRASGYFGPVTKYERETGKQIDLETASQGEDWWPKMVMLKVLQQYYTATSDKRVIPFMTKYFAFQYNALKNVPLSKWTEWAVSRGCENRLIIQWLYQQTHEASLLQLADEIMHQSTPWSALFNNRNWVMNAAALQNDKAWMTRHGVNVAMAIKEPALNYQRTGDTNYIRILNTGWNDIMLLHGLPNGIFSADEDLHGNLPVQGTELCAIVEAMFSLENCMAITGQLHFADALERMAFNALPPQTTPDFNEKQYFQIANQVDVNRGVYNFTLPFDRQMNNVFGAKSGYTCCLANMHQGWPKFTQNLWYKTKDDGLAALIYAPSQLQTKIRGAKVVINEFTDYPFDEAIRFEFAEASKTAFSFQLRIPSWCDNAVLTINGEPVPVSANNNLITLNRAWEKGDIIKLSLRMKITTSSWGGNSRAIERGPLVYALRLKEIYAKGNEKTEGAYQTVFTNDAWNFGLLKTIADNPSSLIMHERPVGKGFQWSQEKAPVEIEAAGKKIPSWIFEKGNVAHQPVTARDGVFKGAVDTAISKMVLIPYGFTRLRIVAFPVVE